MRLAVAGLSAFGAGASFHFASVSRAADVKRARAWGGRIRPRWDDQRVLTSKFPTITRNAALGAPRAVEKTGYRMQAGAQERARVLTGFMRGEIEWVQEPGAHEGQLIGGANYTIYNENGTRYMSAQPMLGPAAEEQREPFRRDLADLYQVP